LITIEYDIREDSPEGTDVFFLETSSIDLIIALIGDRFPKISPIDARTIAELSDGNARVAIALAGTIGKNETIARLSDQDLFKRLFHQRNEPDESLLLAAQALSLVYSYQGEDTSSDDVAELSRLGALVGKSPQEMFRRTAELQRRELVQKRGAWRAVLPQAIANRLAVTALQNIPLTDIKAQLIEGAPERLRKSFSRRLGYLVGNKEAEAIVAEWLGPAGILRNPADLDELGYAMFDNVAPVAPEGTLLALERVLLDSKESETVAKCQRYIDLLRSLAYDPALFERSVALIIKIAEAQEIEEGKNAAAKAFASLFPIRFSGTHAKLGQRLTLIESLVRSDDLKRRILGLMALKIALATSHFGPGYNFEFGSRSRDYGYWPSTKDEVEQWFGQTLSVTETLACWDQPWAPEVRTALAEQFRGLWTNAAAYDSLEHVCHAISKDRFWIQGWLAVRQTLYYDSKGLDPTISARLVSLEALLRPKDVVQNVRSIVLPESVIFFGLDSTYDGAKNVEKTVAEVEAIAHDLGKAVGADNEAFVELLPDLISGSSQQLWNFARGLAGSTAEPGEVWSQLVKQLAFTPRDRQNPHIFRGFLNGLHTINAKLANDLLDNALEDETLAPWYPVLQTAVGIDNQGLNRLIRSLDLGKAWVGTYRNLVGGGVTHQIGGRDFNNLLLRIAREPGGWDIAVEILFMRISFEEGRSQSSTSEIIDIGCALMRQIKFTMRTDPVIGYRLALIAKHCLVGEKGAAAVQEICSNLKDAVSKSETYPFYQSELLQVLLRTQPVVALQTLCGCDPEDLTRGISILDQAGQFRGNALDGIPEGVLLSWCDQQPESRYPAIARGLTAFQPSSDAGRPQWTSIARRLLDKAPDRVAVLRNFVEQFSPPSWPGSHASIVESNTKLLDDLVEYHDAALTEFIARVKIKLAEVVRTERHAETMAERERDERFE
jgi:hypothetical protein